MKERIKNKVGMTYVELLVAFTLLMLIIVSFTPMLISSYDRIYEAGVKAEDTYSAKSTIEQGLALRNSTTIKDFNVNLNNVGDSVYLKFRDVISNTQSGLETLFFGAKGKIVVISAKHLNDDYLQQTVKLQVTGIPDITTIKPAEQIGETVNKSLVTKTQAVIEIVAPERTSTTTGTNVDRNEPYKKNLFKASASYYKLDECSFDAVSGQITIKISGMDLTTTPIRIKVYYLDENARDGDDPKSAETYIYIEAPTMMLVGETSKTSKTAYYTSEGLKENADGSKTLAVDARKLNTDTNVYTDAAGTGVTFKSVKWIDNDTTGGIANYYVLTGTNGAIYRMYTATSNAGAAALKATMTAPGFTKSKDDLYNTKISSFSAVNTRTDERASYYYTINDDGMTVFTYPTVWGGDATHQFLYSTAIKESDYGAPGDRGDDTCWITETGEDSGKGIAGTYSDKAVFSYYYNGMMTEFAYRSQNRRNISYILNEYGCALRCAGFKKNSDDYDGYQQVWNINKKSGVGNSWEYIYYGTSISTHDDEYNDKAFSTIAVKSMNTGSLQDMLWDNNDGDTKYHDYRTSTDVVVEDAVYLPCVGGMFYVGSASANALVTQLDNSRNPGSANQANEYKNGNARWGHFTMYCLIGSSDNNGSYVYKAAENQSNFNLIVNQKDGRSRFMEKETGTQEDYYDDWHTNHECEKIANHTIGETTTSHTHNLATHTSAKVWDRDWRAWNGLPGHTNRCDRGECALSSGKMTGGYCEIEHQRDYWTLSKENRSTCSENFNKAAVHVPFSCWCHGGGYNHISTSDPNRQMPVDGIGERMVRCACGQYHNPTESEVKGNAYWSDLTFDEWFYKYSRSLALNNNTNGLIGSQCYHYCEYCYNTTNPHLYIVHTDAEMYDFTHVECSVCGQIHKSQAEIDDLNYRVCGYHDEYDRQCNSGHNCNGDFTTPCTQKHLTQAECDALNSITHQTKSTSNGYKYYDAGLLKKQPTNTVSTLDGSNAFFVGRDCKSAYFPNLSFSLGFSSNREFVYSNVCYNGSSEVYRSYEKYYFLSHYGAENHTPNFTLGYLGNSIANGYGIYTHDMWNNVNNDYYNVWFPGECYNLTKTASEGGITVAVGYAVSGSTYQYINTISNNNTSTALGGVFNDGVLAACIDDIDGNGQADEGATLKNLLYFKDNGTMDKDYLSTAASDKDTYQTAFGSYGTHARESVRFTSVDLNIQTERNGNSSYYAYYGDSTGRLFRSKVAESTSDAVSLVEYIADPTNTTLSKPSTMEEMLVGGKSLKNYYSEIDSIVAESGIVIVAGKSKETDESKAQAIVAVGVINEVTKDKDGNLVGDNSIEWSMVKLGSGTGYYVNDMCLLDGVLYVVGEKTSGVNNGFFMAVEVAFIKNSANATGTEAEVDSTNVRVKETAGKLYAVAGHIDA